jgi:sugar/nucleoside kinase (ribokinase family)
MVLSYEDLVPASDLAAASISSAGMRQAQALVAEWARTVPLLVVTRGAAGALLFQSEDQPRAFPGYPAREVDPTGAGDVFAAAFMAQLYRTGNPADAMDFANRVAACSVEGLGMGSIPTYEGALARFADPIDYKEHFS